MAEKRTNRKFPFCFRKCSQSPKESSSFPLPVSVSADTLFDEGYMVNKSSPALALKKTKPPLTISTSTGTWEIGKTIGATFTGKVKVGTNVETGQLVEIRILRRQSDTEIEERLIREIAILKRMNHPHICAFQDYTKTNRASYLLLEYIDSGDLLDYIIAHGRLKEKKARKWSRQIASALDYCHRSNIVHRDIKLENVRVTRSGDAKLTGFSWGSLYSPESHLNTFSSSSYFPPPELLEGKPYVGPEVDVFSFGVVIYLMVCARVPFDGDTIPDIHQKIKNSRVKFPWWLSTECKSLISYMMEKTPSSRASLRDVMGHSWMIKGYTTPIDKFLPIREPLDLPLDPNVVRRMEDLGFGEPTSKRSSWRILLDLMRIRLRLVLI